MNNNKTTIIEKTFTLTTPCQLPGDDATLFPKLSDVKPSLGIDELLKIKQLVNDTRSKIDRMGEKAWSRHSSYMNKYAKVAKYIRDFKSGELASNLWVKLYEILKHYENELFTSKSIQSVHLHESTGSFPAALNHYLKTNISDARLEWYALRNSTQYSILASYDTFKNNTADHWLVGNDGNADLKTSDNISSIVEKIKHLSTSISIITADGRVDNRDDPLNEEVDAIPVIYSEIVTAISILSEGGSLIIKFFTLFENFTISMLHLLKSIFTDVQIVKPETSKAGSCELYVVCLGFSGIPQSTLQILLSHVGSEFSKDDLLVPVDQISDEFKVEIVTAANYFSNIQVEAINNILDNYRTAYHDKDAQLRLYSQSAGDLTNKLQIKKLDRSHRLCTEEYITGGYQVQLDDNFNEIRVQVPESEKNRRRSSGKDSRWSGKRSRTNYEDLANTIITIDRDAGNRSVSQGGTPKKPKLEEPEEEEQVIKEEDVTTNAE